MSNELKYHLYGIEALLWIILFWVTQNPYLKIGASIASLLCAIFCAVCLFLPEKNASIPR